MDYDRPMKEETRKAIASVLEVRVERAAALARKAASDAAVKETFRAKAMDLFEKTIRPTLAELMAAIPKEVATAKAFEQDLTKPGAQEMRMGFELEFADQIPGSVKPTLTFKAFFHEHRFAVIWHHDQDGAWRNTEKKSLLPEQITASLVEDEVVEFLGNAAR